MKIPNQIRGINKIRDFNICQLYLSGMTPLEIWDVYAKRHRPLSLRRIQRIISDNSEFINPRVAWPKTKRLHRLQRIADKMPDKLTHNKDVLNVMEEIRKEIDGETPLIDQSTHYHVTKLSDEQLIDQARTRGINLPASVEGRAGRENSQQPS